jgi:hypothetical protein
MKLVQQSMDDRGEHNAHDPDEDQTAEKRIARSEKFGGSSFDRTDRTHAAENHRGFKQRINPFETREPMITGHADKQDERNYAAGDADRHRQSLHEHGERRKLLVIFFQTRKKFHFRYSVGNCVISPGLRSILFTSPR